MPPAVGARGAPVQGVGERQAFIQALSFSVIIASVPVLCKMYGQNCFGG